jgi:hypothetical protein
MALLLAAAGLLAVAQAGLPAVNGAEPKAKQNNQKQDDQQWRFTFHNGEWWYWLPENRWVYWRDNRWNDYNPQTFTYRNNGGAAFVPAGQVVTGYSGYATQTVPNEEIRPYYGHAESQLDRRSLQQNEETGPFYGHALPNEVFGPWRSRNANRPYYGHAISEGD